MAKDYVEQREGGGYYIIGSRVSLDSIVYGFMEGESPESIRQSFATLTLEQVYGAITFYLANKAMVDEYVREGAEEFERARAAQTLPPGLRERLEAARAERQARR